MEANPNRKQFRQIMLLTAGICAIACLTALFFFKTSVFLSAYHRLMGILKPFIYGGVIAYLLNPVCFWIDSHLKKAEDKLFHHVHSGTIRIISIFLSLILMFFLLTLLVMNVIPELISSIRRVINLIPGAVAQFEEWIAALDHDESSHAVIVQLQQMMDTVSERLQQFLQTEVLPNLTNTISSVTSSFLGIVNVIKNLGLGCIVAAYLLGSWEKFVCQARMILYGLFPPKAARWIGKECRYADMMFSGFINGKLLDSLIIGLLCFIYMMITVSPFAMLISIIVAITNIIPFFGPYLGAIPSFLLILTVDPWKALIFLIFVIILQQFDGNILGPAIIGDKVGISGIWILFSILFFGSLWGLTGMLVGVPLFAVIYDMIRSFTMNALQKHGREDLVLSYSTQFAEEEQVKPKKKKPKKEGRLLIPVPGFLRKR